MSRALYTSVSGLKAHQTKMDVISNNIANVNTYGYKTQRVTFRDSFYQSINSGSGSNAATGGLGGQNPSQVGYGVSVSTIDTNHGKTGFASTGYANDAYINGEGLYVVGTLNGEGGDMGQIYYTRIGSFGFDNSNYLVDSAGQLVCAVLVGEGEDGAYTQEDLQPIYVDMEAINEDVTPLTNITVQSDGRVTAKGNDGITYGFGEDGALVPLSGEGAQTTGYLALALADVPNLGGMTMVGNGYYTPSGNAGDINYYQAGTNNMGDLKNGGQEMSGTDISQEFADMIMTQRGFQANSRIINVVDSMLEEVVNLKR